MQKLKKGIAVLVLSAFVMGLGANAMAGETKGPSHSGGRYFSDPSFIGLDKCVLDETDGKAEMCYTGAGLLYAICPSGGTLGKYSLAFDTIAAYTTDEHSRTDIISPPARTSIDTTSEVERNVCWEPRWPVKFYDGLLMIANDAGHTTVYLYRKADGSQ